VCIDGGYEEEEIPGGGKTGERGLIILPPYFYLAKQKNVPL